VDTMGMDVVGDDEMGEDIDGEDIDGLDVVGARGKGLMRALAKHGHFRIKSKAFRNVSPQGVSTPREELDPLPLTTVISVPAGGTTSPLPGFLEAFPQRPFRGERIVLSAIQTLAAGGFVAAGDVTVISPAIFVGAVQVGATQGDMPFSLFAATAFGVRLSIPPMGQGSRIFIPFQFRPNLAAGDNLIISGSIIGRAVR